MTEYTLKLSFDLRQVTQSLAYEFVHNNHSYPQEVGGTLAGTFNFQQDDKIFVEVVATSAAHPNGPGTTPSDVLEDFAVTNCTFVSVPARMTEALSLFDEANACAALGNNGVWDPITKQVNEQENYQQLSRQGLMPLPVVTQHGQWQISGYLSVELTSADGNTHAQLYFFDPESSTGEGGGFIP